MAHTRARLISRSSEGRLVLAFIGVVTTRQKDPAGFLPVAGNLVVLGELGVMNCFKAFRHKRIRPGFRRLDEVAGASRMVSMRISRSDASSENAQFHCELGARS
jgi:hypothetical protein